MKILQIIPFAYLIIGVLFLYEAYTQYSANESASVYGLTVAFGLAAIFMFLFRMRSARKMNGEK